LRPIRGLRMLARIDAMTWSPRASRRGGGGALVLGSGSAATGLDAPGEPAREPASPECHPAAPRCRHAARRHTRNPPALCPTENRYSARAGPCSHKSRSAGAVPLGEVIGHPPTVRISRASRQPDCPEGATPSGRTPGRRIGPWAWRFGFPHREAGPECSGASFRHEPVGAAKLSGTP
jgi:hypothetical protein